MLDNALRWSMPTNGESDMVPMFNPQRLEGRVCLKACCWVFFLSMVSGLARAEILWSGDYETGDFSQWHGDSSAPNFSQMPGYGRPPDYGDGSLLELVTSPVRQGRYAAKFTMKNSLNGSEPEDCDVQSVCDRRRTELTGQRSIPLFYNAIPYMSERWLSVSHFVPADWDSGGGGWGPVVWQVKPLNEYALSPNLSIAISNGNWSITHRWTDVENPSSADVPWQKQMFYTGNYDGQPYPRSDFWPEGLADFPDTATSHAALQSLNKGGWTDWVIQAKFDARGKNAGGTGFVNVWKREDNGSWIHVLNILPKVTSRGGVTFDHGIGYNSPANGSNPGGFGIKAGMYSSVSAVWDLPRNRVIYNDNLRVGSESATFSLMSPDGSSPGSQPPPPPPPPTQSPPEPPALLPIG